MALDAFTRDQDFSTSLEGPTEEEIKAKEAAEREEELVEKIWEPPSEALKKERRDVRRGYLARTSFHALTSPHLPHPTTFSH